MVRHKNEFPEVREVVIGTVKRVNPYSVLVSLEEYPGKEGMIHVSEVARRWVTDIRDHAKEGQKIVALVMRVDKEKGHIALSLKRLRKREADERMKEYKREQKAEKMLAHAAKKMGKDLDEAYEEVGFLLQEKFGEMFKAFRQCLVEDGHKTLLKKGIPEDWTSAIKETAEEQMELKEISLKGTLELTCPSPDGVEVIKKVLEDAIKKHGVEITYISAPKYQIIMRTKDAKKGEKRLEKAAEAIISEIEREGGQGKFEY